MLGLKRCFVAAVAVALTLQGAAFAGNYGLPEGDAAELGFSQEKLDALPAKFAPLINTGKIAGVITAVARDGKIVHFETTGKMDVENDKAMQDDAIFRMFSMSKPITGVAVMILVDEGKVALSDPVSKYIPEFADSQVMVVAEDGSTSLVPANKPITIEHLMTHTSGLVYGIFDPGPVGKAYRDAGVDSSGADGKSLEEFAAHAAAMPLVAHPGEAWNYSIAMDILGRVVEVASGQRFGDFMQARIFEPLGMKDTAFYVQPENAGRLAALYGPSDSGGMTLLDDPAKSVALTRPSLDSGGGGLLGTAADYLRFAQMLLNGGELDGVRIISEESATAMTTNQLPESLGTAPLNTLAGGRFDFSGVGFGYCGSVVMEGYDMTVFGGEGDYAWGGYASTDFWIDPQEGVVGMILTQLLPAGTYPTRIIMQNAVRDAMTESRVAAGHTD